MILIRECIDHNMSAFKKLFPSVKMRRNRKTVPDLTECVCLHVNYTCQLLLHVAGFTCGIHPEPVPDDEFNFDAWSGRTTYRLVQWPPPAGESSSCSLRGLAFPSVTHVALH